MLGVPDGFVRRALSDFANEWGVKVETVVDVAAAQRLISSSMVIDFVLLDLDLPGGDCLDLVKFIQQDAMTVDVSEATVVTLYLLSSSNLKLRPLLTSQLAPGSRIVSHAFSMGDWEPDVLDRYEDERGNTRSLYLWRHDGTVRD